MFFLFSIILTKRGLKMRGMYSKIVVNAIIQLETPCYNHMTKSIGANSTSEKPEEKFEIITVLNLVFLSSLISYLQY